MIPSSLALAMHAASFAALAWLLAQWILRPDLVRFSCKAVVRRRGTTAVVFSTTFVCVLSLLSMGGYFQQSFWGLSESTIRGQTGHFQIMRKGWEEHSRTDPWSWKLPRPGEVAKLFASDSFLAARVEVVAPELSFTGILSNGASSKTFLGRAVDPSADRKLSAFGESVARGGRLTGGDGAQAVVGAGLAKALAAEPGKGLTLLTTTSRGSMASADLEVEGVVESFSRDYDDVALKIPLATAWGMLGDTLCDKVLVLLRDTRDLDAVLARTRVAAARAGMDLEFRRWEDLATYHNAVKELYTGIFRFFGVVLLVFSLVFVTSIVEISFLHRRQEMALLRSFGTTGGALLRRTLSEGVVLALVGTAVATVLSLGLVALFNLHGLEAPPPPGSSRGYRIVLRVFEEPGLVLQVFEFVFLAVSASVVVPSLRACRRPLVESLRHG